jgi:hypothetical protein
MVRREFLSSSAALTAAGTVPEAGCVNAGNDSD